MANRDPVRANPFIRPCPLQEIKSQLSTIVVSNNSNKNILIITTIISTNNYNNIF